MFTLKFHNGMHHEDVYSVSNYTVRKPLDCREDSPHVSFDLNGIEMNVPVTDALFVMNEAGKTVDVIRADSRKGQIGGSALG